MWCPVLGLDGMVSTVRLYSERWSKLKKYQVWYFMIFLINMKSVSCEFDHRVCLNLPQRAAALERTEWNIICSMN